MKLNVAVKQQPEYTHEGARAARLDPEAQLRRSVMACMLWEDSFYESGEEIGKRIGKLVPLTRPEFAAACAYHARTDMKLRHAPLLIVREMARHPGHKALVAALLRDVIQRPDELAEFLAIYWKDKRQPLSAQVKKGLARAFLKFNEYQLAKYDRDGKVKLRDALFLSHAKPRTEEQAALFKKVVDRQLAIPDTWEVALSGGADKKETFERLMAEEKLGALAFIRNLRNMKEAGVQKATVAAYAGKVNIERVLPFRFIAAARACPGWEDMIEPMMLRCLEGYPKLPGKTAIVVDNSGSMCGRVAQRSDLSRGDAACALAILVREVCADCVVIGFGSEAAVIPSRRGFALAQAIQMGPGGGTDTGSAVHLAGREGYDRIIVITDEQSHTGVDAPRRGIGYFINVANMRNGIGYGPWVHIDGWSEAVLDYIRESEANG
jgi:hypothetical protein